MPLKPSDSEQEWIHREEAARLRASREETAWAQLEPARAVFRRVDGIADIFERNPRYTANAFLVIDQNNAPAVFVRHNVMSPWWWGRNIVGERRTMS
mgnify:CR=1 FL=1